MSPEGSRHGDVTAEISARLRVFAQDHRLGSVLAAETGFLIARDRDTVLAPDVSFIAQSRLGSQLPDGFFPGPPDLAVEVLSPGVRASQVAEKIEMWLTCGCHKVWVVDPRRQRASMHRLVDGKVACVETDLLANETLLPGFRLPLSELFA